MHDCASLYITAGVFVNVSASQCRSSLSESHTRIHNIKHQRQDSESGITFYRQYKRWVFLLFELWTQKCHGRAALWLTMCSDSFEETCKHASKTLFIHHISCRGKCSVLQKKSKENNWIHKVLVCLSVWEYQRGICERHMSCLGCWHDGE